MSTSTDDHLFRNEQKIVELDGVVRGYTRWSGLGGIFGVVLALTVPRVFNLGFLVGAVSIVVVVTAMFLLVYYVIGGRLAARSHPTTRTPYITLLLTDRRLLLFDRGLGSEELELVEEALLKDVESVRYGKAGVLVPQSVGYLLGGVEPREFEFARGQQARALVDRFGR